MSLYLGDTLISGAEQFVGEIRNIGQIIPSTIPLTDAGLHLLDGALIQGSGIYSAFVTAMAATSATNPELFCTEQEWQQSVTDYGVCGKFVYDSVNNTLRLQKFYSAERYLIASSSNGTQWCRVYSDGWCEQGGYYANSSSSTKSFTFLKPFSNNNYYLSSSATYISNGGTDHQESMSEFVSRNANGFTKYIWKSTNNFYWKACGYIDISTYKLQTQYQYIVIATSTKTDIQVDIDEIATDLNGKADVDLTNVNNAGTSLGAGWAMPSDTYDDLTLGAHGTTYTAPANGWYFIEKSTAANGQYVGLFVRYNGTDIYAACQYGNSGERLRNLVPVQKGWVCAVGYNASGTTHTFRFIYAQGSESEAQ